MIHVDTKNGFACDIDEGALDDIELLEAFVELNRGNLATMPAAVRGLLGEDGKARLYAHLRGENGRVSTTAVSDVLTEIVELLGDKSKNS